MSLIVVGLLILGESQVIMAWGRVRGSFLNSILIFIPCYFILFYIYIIQALNNHFPSLLAIFNSASYLAISNPRIVFYNFNIHKRALWNLAFGLLDLSASGCVLHASVAIRSCGHDRPSIRVNIVSF